MRAKVLLWGRDHYLPKKRRQIVIGAAGCVCATYTTGEVIGTIIRRHRLSPLILMMLALGVPSKLDPRFPKPSVGVVTRFPKPSVGVVTPPRWCS